MEDFTKKLSQLKDLLKAIKKPTPPASQMTIPKLPGIKPPAMPSITPTSSIAPKIGAGAGPDSKKDPKKVAEQIKNGSMSTKTQKAMLKADNDNEKRYHILTDGHPITKNPLTVKELNEQHGGIKRLEAAGHIVAPHDPTNPNKYHKPLSMVKADKNGQWYLEPTDPSNI